MKAIEDQGFNGYFWLVNNDTVADQNALKELLEETEKKMQALQGLGLNFPEIVRAVPQRFIRSGVPLKDPVFSEIRLTNTLRERHS